MGNRTTATLASVAAAVLAAALLSACGSSTDPGGEPGTIEPTITYEPSAPAVACSLDGTTMLRATVAGADRVQHAWTVAGEPAGIGASLVYEPRAIGADTVTVSISADGRPYGRSWVLLVYDPLDALPLPVPELFLEHGAAPGTVLVRWLQPPPNGEAIAGYLVAANYDRAITTANWGAATELGFVPRDSGALTLSATFGEADGLTRSGEAWFAVRTRDARGRLAPVAVTLRHDITYAWSIAVTLDDDLDRPVPDAPIAYGGGTVRTDLQGRATIGPLRSSDPVHLAVQTPHFAPRPVDLDAANGDVSLSLTLLTRYEAGHEPCGPGEPADFLALFRRATLTGGLDVWNAALGETYLVAAADSLGADIEFSFRTLTGFNGFTTLLEPSGELGEVIPRRIRLDVELALDGNAAPQAIWVTEIALHELGHALGFYGHLCGPGKGNLMDWSGAIGSLADGPDQAIHPDEVRVVRAVRYLPQGLDVSLW